MCWMRRFTMWIRREYMYVADTFEVRYSYVPHRLDTLEARVSYVPHTLIKIAWLYRRMICITTNIYTPTAFFNDEPIWSNCVHFPIIFNFVWTAIDPVTQGNYLIEQEEEHIYSYNYTQIYFPRSEFAQILSTVSNVKKINIFCITITQNWFSWGDIHPL